MKTIKYQSAKDTTESATQTLTELEALLGIALSNKNTVTPNSVNGYVNVYSDGSVEVNLYDTNDLSHLTSNAPIEIHSKSDEFIIEKCKAYFEEKGYKKHNDMGDNEMITITL